MSHYFFTCCTYIVNSSSKKYTGETAVVSARLPLDLIKKIDEICDATGRTKNEIIQICLEFSVDNIEIEK